MTVIILSFVAIIAMFVVAGQVKASNFELVLLFLSVLAQLISYAIGQLNDPENPHTGGVMLAWIVLVGIATFLGELFLALRSPSRWRFLLLTGVAGFPALLCALW